MKKEIEDLIRYYTDRALDENFYSLLSIITHEMRAVKDAQQDIYREIVEDLKYLLEEIEKDD